MRETKLGLRLPHSARHQTGDESAGWREGEETCAPSNREGKLLVNLLNYCRRERTVVLETGSVITSAVNLFDNTEVTFPITILPLDPILLAIGNEDP
jgi:hypothetical protein